MIRGVALGHHRWGQRAGVAGLDLAQHFKTPRTNGGTGRLALARQAAKTLSKPSPSIIAMASLSP